MITINRDTVAITSSLLGACSLLSSFGYGTYNIVAGTIMFTVAVANFYISEVYSRPVVDANPKGLEQTIKPLTKKNEQNLTDILDQYDNPIPDPAKQYSLTYP